ncbi:MAG: hypothetical protein HQ546_07220 [Planctomycetes bacterium]|nr:hypothetical protein [Planctomycetota bacterium]
MAKASRIKRKSTRSKASSTGAMRQWWHGLPDERRRTISLGASRALVVFVFAWAAGLGLWVLRDYVSRQPVYAQNVARIELADKPAWMSESLAQDICWQLRSAKSSENETFDRNLAPAVSAAAIRCPWVRKLHEVAVVRTPADSSDTAFRAGVILVRAEWRRPVAIGVWGGHEEVVDEYGVVLPWEQSCSLGAGGLPRIVGLAGKSPEIGRASSAEDLMTGLKVVELLREKPYYAEIIAVDVDNIDQRRNLRDSAIRLLATADGDLTEIRFGDLPPESQLPIGEPSTQRKIGYLDGWYRRNNHRLAGPNYLDLRSQELRLAEAPEPAF